MNERILVGNRVTIYPRGKKKIWCADFWRDGEHRKQSLKTSNKKVAVERATTLAASLSDGSYHRPLPSVMIAETAEAYMDFLKTEDRARRTIVKYRGILNTLVDFLRELGITRMAQFTATQFDKFRAHRKQDHHVKTLYTEGVVIKQFFRWAKKRRIVLENPLDEIKLAKPKLVPKKGPSMAEIDLILDGADGRLRAIIAIAGFTGMRSGEQQRLRKEDVDFDAGWIHVVSRPGAETKTRETRKIPLHPRLREILLALPKSNGPWFFNAEPSPKYPQGGHWISPKKVNDSFKVLLKKLNLSVGRDNGYTIHSLRHSFETICINARIPQRVVDAWLGHTSDRSMAAVYYYLSDEESQRFIKLVPFGTGVSAADADEEKVS
jgi:site-specific recombinase XerD